MSVKNFKNQKGNVLFLILIAVALFAALSYAVTQSSRSGGDASKETNVINTASLTQYPNSIRTSVLRLIISGLDPLNIYFNTPEEFEGSGFSYFDGREGAGVFHPKGGGAAYQQIPSNLTTALNPVNWRFNADFEIPLLGLSQTNSGNGNELIAFAVGVTESICGRVNRELHNDPDGYIPVLGTAVTIENNRTAEGSEPTNPTTETILTADTSPSGSNWFSNKAFGCFKNGSGVSDPYVFFYVLAER